MAAQTANTLQEVYDNYARILLLLTRTLANPTQTNVDSVVSAAAGAGVVGPKPTYTLDGETYNWMEYQQFIIQSMTMLREQIIMAAGPFENRNIGLF